MCSVPPMASNSQMPMAVTNAVPTATYATVAQYPPSLPAYATPVSASVSQSPAYYQMPPNYGCGPPVANPVPPQQTYGPPQSLTAGLPDPASVERQKAGYLRTLEEQEKQSTVVLDQQRKQQLEYIQQQADQQRKQLYMEIDQQVKHQEMAL